MPRLVGALSALAERLPTALGQGPGRVSILASILWDGILTGCVLVGEHFAPGGAH